MNARTKRDSRVTVLLVCVALLLAAFNPLCASCAASEEGGGMACCDYPMTVASMKACHKAADSDMTIQSLPCHMAGPADLLMMIPDNSQSQKAQRDIAVVIPTSVTLMENTFTLHKITTTSDSDHPVYLKNHILRI